MNTHIEITENNSLRRTATRGGILVITAFLVTALWWGCEGPMGPAGEGVEDLDLVDPTVELIDPLFGTSLRSLDVYVDSLEIKAVASDDIGVEYVEFFFDGSSQMGDDSAIDSTAPYLWTWKFDSSGHEHGVYPLSARAYDASGNSGDSPVVFVTYKNPPVVDTLSEHGISESLGVMTMPGKYDDSYWNVRMSPVETARLLAIHLQLNDPLNEVMTETSDSLVSGADFNVYAWDSNSATGLPVSPALDSTLVPEENAVYSEIFEDLWTIIDVSDWNLVFDNKFHVGFSVPDYQNMKAQLRAVPIRVNLNPLLDNPNDHSSIEYSTGEWGAAGWGTMQDHWDYPQRIDFRIRAEVEYEDGTRAMLRPDGTSTPVME